MFCFNLLGVFSHVRTHVWILPCAPINIQASAFAAGSAAELQRLKSNGSTRSSPTESTSELSASRLCARSARAPAGFSTRLPRASGPSKSPKALANVYTGRFPPLFKSATRRASLRRIRTPADIGARFLLDFYWISFHFSYSFIIIFIALLFSYNFSINYASFYKNLINFLICKQFF